MNFRFVGTEKLLAGSVFQNELGNRIDMQVQRFSGPADGHDDIHISISGPSSDFTCIITPEEANELHRMLGKMLPK